MTGHNRKNILFFIQSGTRYKTRFSIHGPSSEKPLAEIHRLKTDLSGQTKELSPSRKKYRFIDLVNLLVYETVNRSFA